jgi:hypothetical protein
MHVEVLGTLASSQSYNVRRREPRYVSCVPVTLQRYLRFGPAVTRGVMLDISEQGMSALVCGAPRAGETVVIVLSLSGGPSEMLATVRHSSDAKSGFEFYPLSPIAQQALQDYIEKLKEQEEMLFPCWLWERRKRLISASLSVPNRAPANC